MFILKGKQKKYNRETRILNSSATPHMKRPEENMIYLRDTETQFTVGDSGPLTRTNLGD